MSVLKIYSKRINPDGSSPTTDCYGDKDLLDLKQGDPWITDLFIPKNCTVRPKHAKANSVIKYKLQYGIIPSDSFKELIKKCHTMGLHLTSYWPNGLEFKAYSELYAVLELKSDDCLYADFYSITSEKAYTLFIEFRKLLLRILKVKENCCKDFILAPDGERFEIARLETERALGNTSVVGGNGNVYKLDDLGLPIPPQGEAVFIDFNLRKPSIQNLEQKNEPKKVKTRVEIFKDVTTGLNNIRWLIIPAGVILVVWILYKINPTLAQNAWDFFKELFKNNGLGG